MQIPNASVRVFADIAVGDEARFECAVTAELVDSFAKISGDYNPLHTDEAYAATTPFGARIAHGMLAGALFSQMVSMHLPGKFCLYLSQTLQFRSPMYLGTEVVITGTVAAKSEAAQTLTVALAAADKKTGMTLVTGEALVQVSA